MESLCVKVPRPAGESTRKSLIELHLLDNNLKIKSNKHYIFIPVSKPIEGLGELGTEFFEIAGHENPMPPVSGAYELIGDIAIIDQHEKNPLEMANVLLKHKNIKTIFQATSAVSGEYRTREVSFIKGEKKTETIYRENGCKYLLDVTQVYFTPRLSTERMRITAQVKNGDTVVDMFAGIGPFSILIAKTYPDSYVIAVDKNPVAIKYLRENARLNKIKNIEIREGDAKNEIKGISDADHVIMNLPHSGFEFLDSTFGIIKRGGIIHFYAISHEADLFEGLTGEIEACARKAGLQVFSLDRRIVRPYAPYQYNICIDFQVSSQVI
ncbi:MAG: class I SAM-dependent methyltransferase family protein [Candidatus Methanoperedenaceae archaeon]|nr:MAG: class I SAM-dependent methyltransferase family protein [Candidatus Methanoperedenaceae archaeon]